MKHLARINLEFIKEARNWDDLTLEEQKGYLQRHPKSKRKINARPELNDSNDEKKDNIETSVSSVIQNPPLDEATQIKEYAKKMNKENYDDLSPENKKKIDQLKNAFKKAGYWEDKNIKFGQILHMFVSKKDYAKVEVLNKIPILTLRKGNNFFTEDLDKVNVSMLLLKYKLDVMAKM